MTNLITEAREMCELRRKQKHIPMTMLDKTLELCDALEKATAKNDELIRELSELARESVKRDMALAMMEAEVGVALGKGCDYCGLIYAIHAESYGIEDLDCANEPIDNKFCPMCGKRLEVKL